MPNLYAAALMCAHAQQGFARKRTFKYLTSRSRGQPPGLLCLEETKQLVWSKNTLSKYTVRANGGQNYLARLKKNDHDTITFSLHAEAKILSEKKKSMTFFVYDSYNHAPLKC